MKSAEFKAGEQHVYAYQRDHAWATLRYAVKMVLGFRSVR